MQTIIIRLIDSNSKQNKQLFDYLKKVVKSVLAANYKFKIEFVKSDGKTRYPRVIINRQSYIGLTEIRSGISKVSQLADNQKKRLNAGDMTRNFQLRGLYEGDNSDSEDSDYLDEESLQDRMSEFRRKRGVRGGNDDAASEDSDASEAPKKKKSKKKKSKKRSKAVVEDFEPPAPSHKKKKKGKSQPVMEAMNDDDIGGAFGDIPGHKDNATLEAYFAGQQESFPGM